MSPPAVSAVPAAAATVPKTRPQGTRFTYPGQQIRISPVAHHSLRAALAMSLAIIATIIREVAVIQAAAMAVITTMHQSQQRVQPPPLCK